MVSLWLVIASWVFRCRVLLFQKEACSFSAKINRAFLQIRGYMCFLSKEVISDWLVFCISHLDKECHFYLYAIIYFKLGLWDTCYCYKWGHGILPLLFECPVWNAHFWKSKADLTKKSWNETKASFFPTLDSKQIHVIIRA